MVKIKSRAEILKQNQSLAEWIIRTQIIRNQAEEDTRIETESIDLESFIRIITKANKRSEELKKMPLRFMAGDDDYPFHRPSNKEFVAEDIYKSSKYDDSWENNIDELLDMSLEERNALFEKKDWPDEQYIDCLLTIKDMQNTLNAKHLLAISNSIEAWLDQWNDFELLNNAIKFLKDKIDTGFNGGFELSGEDIVTYIPHLDILAIELYLAFENSSTIMFICKYGNIHLKFYDESERELLTRYLESRKFKKISSCGTTLTDEQSDKLMKQIFEAADDDDDDDDDD